MTDDIINWATEGKKKNASYLIIVFDKKKQKEAPVFVSPGANVIQQIREIYGTWYLQLVGIIDLMQDIPRQAKAMYSLNGEVFKN
jgi:hypothetical protein